MVPTEHAGAVDLVVRGGRVLDPSLGIDAVADIAVKDDRIHFMGPDVAAGASTQVVDASGCLVTAGLIDLHVHGYPHIFPIAIDPDEVGVFSGSTTVVDCSAAPETFDGFREFVIARAATRVLAYLRISPAWWFTVLGLGLDPSLTQTQLHRLLDPDAAHRIASDNREIVRGIKVYAYGPAHGPSGAQAMAIGKQCAVTAGLPLVAHISHARSALVAEDLKTLTADLLAIMTRGDVVIHWGTGRAGSLLEDGGPSGDVMRGAIENGVRFDVAHGLHMFSFATAKRLLAEGHAPDTISTDIHKNNRHQVVFDLPTTMAKFLALGMSLDDVVARTTSNPARVLGLDDRLGSLAVGREADITILRRVEGEFRFEDSHGDELGGMETLVPVAVVRAGRYIECRPSTFLAASRADTGDVAKR